MLQAEPARPGLAPRLDPYVERHKEPLSGLDEIMEDRLGPVLRRLVRPRRLIYARRTARVLRHAPALETLSEIAWEVVESSVESPAGCPDRSNSGRRRRLVPRRGRVLADSHGRSAGLRSLELD